ncbi:MAG: choice-of-anchor V domain-containing protein [Bacteroidota bacterium]
MQRFFTTRRPLLLGLSLCLALAFVAHDLISRSGGAPDGRTGAPGDLTCQNGCHSTFALNAGSGGVSISTTIPETGYISGTTYQVTITAKEQGISKFGFGALALDNTNNAGIGTVTITDADNTQASSAGGKEYITHTAAGNAGGTDSLSWTYDWTAPAQGTGGVTFYATAVAASQTNGNKDDNVYSSSVAITESVTNSLEFLSNIDEIKLFPTLVSDRFKVELQAGASVDFELSVVNNQGQIVHQMNRVLAPGFFDYAVSTVDWAAGMYYVRIRSDKSQGFEKIIVR